MVVKKHQIYVVDCPVCLSELAVDLQSESIEARAGVKSEREKLRAILEDSGTTPNADSDRKAESEGGESETEIQAGDVTLEGGNPNQENPEKTEEPETGDGNDRNRKRKNLFGIGKK